MSKEKKVEAALIAPLGVRRGKDGKIDVIVGVASTSPGAGDEAVRVLAKATGGTVSDLGTGSKSGAHHFDSSRWGGCTWEPSGSETRAGRKNRKLN